MASRYTECMLNCVLRLAFIIVLGMAPFKAHADPVRDFVVSCSYGVLAGTLVGAATLAFSERPGENLNKVARGASLGLYAGILLGAYIVYGVPGGAADEEDAAAALDGTRGGLDDLTHIRRIAAAPRFMVAPLVGERGVEGLTSQFRVLEF